MLVAVCSGLMSTDVSGMPVCKDASGVAIAWSAVDANTLQYIPFDPSQLDPASMVSAFTAGFAIVLVVWAVGWGAAQLLDFVRRG